MAKEDNSEWNVKILGSYSCLLFLLSGSIFSFGEYSEKYNREGEGKFKIY